MLVNALIGAVSTLVLFFFTGEAATHRHEQRAAWTCPLRDGTRRGTGIADDGILHKYRYRAILLFGTIGVLFAFL